MAAKAAGLDFEEFHAWSANGANYKNESDCKSVWRSIKNDKGVGIASLFHMAIEQGWHDSKENRSRPIAKPMKAAPLPAIPAESAKAAHVWGRCEPAPPDHSYITKKNGNPDGLRIYPHSAQALEIRGQNVAGFLVVPCWAAGKLQTLQFIPSEGDKLNLPGSSFNDGFFTVGDIAAAGRAYIVEGIGQAWAVHGATGAAAVVCFGAGRMKRVAEVLRVKYPNARLILVPDRGKENDAQKIAATINAEWCELPTDKPNNYDANDYALEFGADAMETLIEQTQQPPMRFKLCSAADLCAAPPMRWMVQGVLPMEGLAALYGASGSGKSFLALDIAGCVAAGECKWFGRRVTQCPVTYCALEGEAGMNKRIEAWSLHHEKNLPDCLQFITQQFNLLDGADVADVATAIISAGCAGGLIILDTLARAAPGGDENSSSYMGSVIAAAKDLQNLVGGLVLLVHHSGKDTSKGMRGHSSLYAALDGAIEVSKANSRHAWSVAKSKDDETGAVHFFKLEVVKTGADDDGERITSCVVVADDSKNAIQRVALPSGENQNIAIGILKELLCKSNEVNKDGAPKDSPCIRLDEAVRLVSAGMGCASKHKSSRAREAVNGLVERGAYGLKDGWLWRI